MLGVIDSYSGISTNDIAEARRFYSEVLGLSVESAGGDNLFVRLPTGGSVLIYPKDDHVAASFTVLNFAVEDVDAAVADLAARGVEVLRYEGMWQDELGIARGKDSGFGPDIAWFADPAGNIFSVLTD